MHRGLEQQRVQRVVLQEFSAHSSNLFSLSKELFFEITLSQKLKHKMNLYSVFKALFIRRENLVFYMDINAVYEDNTCFLGS